MLETAAAWNEALLSVPEERLDDAYRAAYAQRLEDAPESDYPLKAIEVLRAWHRIDEAERQQRAAARAQQAPELDYWDRVARVSANAFARRCGPDGWKYVTPETVAPPPSELPARESTAGERYTRTEFIALAEGEGTDAERRAGAILARRPLPVPDAPRAERLRVVADVLDDEIPF